MTPHSPGDPPGGGGSLNVPPQYDRDLHHVGLVAEGQELYYGVPGYMTVGEYRRSLQDYDNPQEYGGQRDLVGSPNVSRWTQDDFSGGIFQQTWGGDRQAVYATRNVLPTQYDRTLRSTAPILPRFFYNPNDVWPYYCTSVGGFLYACFNARVLRWIADPNLSPNQSPGILERPSVTYGARIDKQAKLLFMLEAVFASPGVYGIQRYTVPDLAFQGTIWAPPATPGSPIGVPRGLEIGTSHVFVGYNDTVWAVVIPDDKATIPGTGDWIRVGRLLGNWRDSLSYNGLTYILCSDGQTGTSVCSTDGLTVIPVCELPYNFTGNCIVQYGGRLYVGGSGRDMNDNDAYAELYEITAGSLRLVRSWKTESMEAQGVRPATIRTMVAHEGLLYINATGYGLYAYDVTTDAFYGASSFDQVDGQKDVRFLVSNRKDLWGFTEHPIDHGQCGWYKVADRNDPGVPDYSGWVVTSDFAPEPARRKRWQEFVVLTRRGGCNVGYSTSGGAPGGDSYTELGGQAYGHGDYWVTKFGLQSVEATPQIRFRIRLPRGTDAHSFTELCAFTLGFNFLDTGRWVWSFTINGAEIVELQDGASQLNDCLRMRTLLGQYAREALPLVFYDVDGESYHVQMREFLETKPNITGRLDPFPLVSAEPGGGPSGSATEGFYQVTLAEIG